MGRQREKQPNPKTPEGQFALYLAHLMERRSMDAAELAKESGISRATIFNWLREDGSPDVGQMGKLATAFGLKDWRKLCPPDGFLATLPLGGQ